VKDLAGHRATIGPPGGAVPEIAERVLKSAGVWEATNTSRRSFTEGVSAFRAGEVDAFFTGIINNRTNSATLELWNTEDIDFVKMSQPTIDRFLDQYPFFSVVDVNTDHPVWPDAINTQYSTIKLPELNSTSLMRPDLPGDLVYQASKVIHENQEALGELNQLLWGIGFGEVTMDGETIDRWGIRGQLESVPIHQGAARYLKEIDEWDDSYTVAN
jgi:TRAP transporter TAXI family solute receptor